MTVYLTTITVMLIILVVCIAGAAKSERPLAKDVFFLLCYMVLPLAANEVIALAESETIAKFAYLLYFIGTDLMLYSLVRYSVDYCDIKYDGSVFKKVLIAITVADIFLVLLNPFLGHVFELEESRLDSGEKYIKLVSLWYHKIHLGVSYMLGLITALIFTIKTIRSSKLVRGKYLMFLVPFLLTAVWETHYIFLNRPLDYSMVGYAVCGIVVFYFAVVYVPTALMDRMKSTIVSSISDGVIFFDDNNRCIYANSNAELIFDIKSEAELEGIRARFLKIMDVDEKEIAAINSKKFTKKYHGSDGEKTFEIEYHRLYDGRGHGIGAFARFIDRTEELDRMQKEHYMATHDKLTGLYNAPYFYELVERRLKADPDRKYLAMSTDVRGFKLINDRYGRPVGDELLIKIANVIENNSSKHTLYGRLSGDKFGLLIPAKHYKEETILRAIKELDEAVSPDYKLLIHLGVYEVTESDKRASVMFDRAAMAINDIKDDLEIRIAYYSDRMRDEMLWEQKIASSLDDAVSRGCVMPFLQAQVDKNGKVSGAEVLVRWEHDEEGMLMPQSFISVLEKNGTIAKLDKYMWESACRILRKWSMKGIDDLYLSVNISPRDFYLLDVPQVLEELTDLYEVDRKKLRLEITETIMMDDVNMKLEAFAKLRAMGFILEMDDFGSGYSSLNMLKDMPVDVLKLDMVFMSDTANKEKNDKIVKLIVKLAGELGIHVIAEGVETGEQVRSLSEMGCLTFQGYYFAKPIPLVEFEKRHVG